MTTKWVVARKVKVGDVLAATGAAVVSAVKGTGGMWSFVDASGAVTSAFATEDVGTTRWSNRAAGDEREEES